MMKKKKKIEEIRRRKLKLIEDNETIIRTHFAQDNKKT